MRAAGWMTSGAAARTQIATASGGGGTWVQLASHGGWTTADTQPDTEPPPPVTDGRTARRVLVRVTFHTDDQAPMSTQTWLVAVALEQAAGGAWSVTEVLSRSANQ